MKTAIAFFVLLAASVYGDQHYHRVPVSLPEKHYQLTSEERTTFMSLRKQANDAFQAQEAYENLLIRRRGLKPFDATEPCPHFVGIKEGDDFITYDPTPMDVTCQKSN